MDNGHQSAPVELAEHPDGHRGFSPVGTAVTSLLMILVVSLGAWLFAPSDTADIQPPQNVDSLPYVDGVLVEVDLPRLVMDAYTPIDGKSELEFRVRQSDEQYFDVVHLRAHSSIGLPTRLFYEKEADVLWAVYKEDAPANSVEGE